MRNGFILDDPQAPGDGHPASLASLAKARAGAVLSGCPCGAGAPDDRAIDIGCGGDIEMLTRRPILMKRGGGC